MKQLLFILFFIPIGSQGFSQFKANMENVISGDKELYSVYSDKTQYRYDFTQDGQKMIIIVKPQLNKTLILLPDKKFYMQQTCYGMMSRQNDPVQAYTMMKVNYNEKDAGKENVERFACNKKEIYADNDKIITAWYSESLNFPLKMVNHLYENTYMNLKDIQSWKPDQGFFKVPDDYTEVDDRMRPVIPEPPAPEKWETKTITLPFEGTLSRGTKIRFKINEDKHYKFSYVNETDKPAKFIRHTFVDGKEKPDSKQGPIKYRTYRPYPGDKATLTYVWIAGEDILLEIYEGKIHLHIFPEK